MSKKLDLEHVTWYTLEPRRLSSDRPSIVKGDMLHFNRSLTVYKLKTITYMKNGRWKAYTEKFPKGTLALYLGEYDHEGKSSALVPDLLLFISGKTYVFSDHKVRSLKKVVS